VGLPTRSDVNALVNQVAALERQLRELAARDEQRNGDRPAPRARRASR
jgi:polyhydroxyalkanoate synthesis regulator phasin